MKRTNKIFKAIRYMMLFLLVGAAVLSSLAGCGRKLESHGMSIYDKKSGSSYKYLPACFEAAAKSKDAYGSIEISGAKQGLYSIHGLDTSLWLCTEWGDVLYAGDDSIETLDAFKPARAYLCYTGGSVSISFAVVEGDAIDEVMDAWDSGKTVTKPLSEPDETYAIKFESDKYPGLYYSMSVLVYGKDVYIYNKYEGAKCIVAPDSIALRLEESEYADDAE